MLRAKIYILFAAIFLTVFAGTALAGPSEGETGARRGVVRCGGNNFLRLNGTESQTTFYVLRNYNSAISITIDRMIFFKADGSVLADSAVLGLPGTANGILGPLNNTLQPNQTALFASQDFLPFLDNLDRPIQLEIQWSAPEKALILDVSLVRVGRQRDPATGNMLAERSRFLRECTSISLR